MCMKVRAHLLVSGRVQGVYFRQSTLLEAQNLGVKGWVRNLMDGRVEAVFEGDFGFFKQRYLSDINLINFR